MRCRRRQQAFRPRTRPLRSSSSCRIPVHAYEDNRRATIRGRPVRARTRHDRIGRGGAPAGSNPVRRIGAGGRKKSTVVVIGFMSAVTPIDNDYGQEDLVAALLADGVTDAA